MAFTSRSYTSNSIGQRTMSVYGGAGGHGTRISTGQIGYSSNTGNFNLPDYHDLKVDANEKFALQNLNERLASYLEKVHSMEKENNRLEKQIKEWYTSKTVITHDYSAYFVTIADLQDKIRAASTVNAKLYLEIDNSKLAADDFRMKYENELSMRQSVEVDIAGLRKMMDDLNLHRMELESTYESLKDERIMLQKNHEEEMGMVKTQMSGQVNVEVDAPTPVNLGQVMAELREHYEALIAKNRREAELWFQNKSTVVTKDVEVNSTSLDAARIEMKELKSTLQTLQIDLQSQMSMKSSLEGTLQETQQRFALKLREIQAFVLELEAQLSSLNVDASDMKLKYDSLLDLKTRLEAEIAEYRRLLEGRMKAQNK